MNPIEKEILDLLEAAALSASSEFLQALEAFLAAKFGPPKS